MKLGTDLVNEAPGHVIREYLFLYSITLLRSVYLKGKSSTRLVLAVPYVKQFTKKQWSELIPEKPGEFNFVLPSDRVKNSECTEDISIRVEVCSDGKCRLNRQKSFVRDTWFIFGTCMLTLVGVQ